MKISYIIIGLFSILSIGVVISCSKSNSESTTKLTINLTDTPYNAQEVNIDIQQVRVRMSDDSTAWQNLSTNAGVYDLLDFQNGIDTALATGTVSTGNVRELRFILGSNNSIKINNVTYPLTIPSGSESGLKIKIGKNLAATADSLLIDFDANASIIRTGSGDYKLSPVLKLK